MVSGNQYIDAHMYRYLQKKGFKMTNTETERIKAELQEHFWEEYREYIKVTPMTACERRLLRKWVSECHSVYHDPGSRYLGYSSYPMSFLSVYRMDRELDHELKGYHGEERVNQLKKIIGWTDSTK